MTEDYKEILINWNQDSREVAETVIGKYGSPDEFTKTSLIWYNNGPWIKTIAYEEQDEHYFPMKHMDSLEMSIYYHVSPEKTEDITRFDGSITFKRTPGILSAKCHDEEANFLAINLAHDINIGKKTAEEAREFYVEAMKDFRKGVYVPYMNALQFEPQKKKETQDRDQEMITKEELDAISKIKSAPQGD